MTISSPNPPDPLAQVVTLLQPRAASSKLVLAGGAWAVRRSDVSLPFYCMVLEGRCRLLVGGEAAVTLEPGDFVLAPAADDFATSSLEPPPGDAGPRRVEVGAGVFRLGDPDAPINVRMLVGHCSFGSDDAGLLVSLLPRLVLVRGERRLTVLVELVDEELRAERPGKGPVLTRLVELLLIEALRSTGDAMGPPGLLRGLSDPRLGAALRCMHQRPERRWTVTALAGEAAMSRSAFFDRFQREVGSPPMTYLLGWRLAIAKSLLGGGGHTLAEIAERVGYGSASAFSTAFARQVGQSPTRYAQPGGKAVMSV